jgi:FHS family glucose/mannose:H+ symporter-like MFS transporter
MVPEYSQAGQYFLSLGAGVALSGFAMQRLKLRIGLLLPIACGVAWAAMVHLAMLEPSASVPLRVLGWVVIGLAAGVLNSCLFETIRAEYQRDPASTVNLAGVYFGLGCLASALLLAGTFYLYSVSTVLLLVSVVPGLFGFLYYCHYRGDTQVVSRPPTAEVFSDFLSPAAVLFALLLFFQSGNEWAIAGWLPLYLIRKIGMSPEGAIWTLAVYWLALLVGRLVSVYLLARVRHSRLLLTSATCALFGCVLLMFAANRLGATVGVLFCGGGFAVIYPLVVERIGRRFPYYHPGVFNGVFSIALAGGLLSPWMIGIFADSYGAWVVMGLPVLGTLAVVILILLIWLENKVTGF